MTGADADSAASWPLRTSLLFTRFTTASPLLSTHPRCRFARALIEAALVKIDRNRADGPEPENPLSQKCH